MATKSLHDCIETIAEYARANTRLRRYAPTLRPTKRSSGMGPGDSFMLDTCQNKALKVFGHVSRR